MRGSLQSYRKVSVESDLSVASPHRVIQMMLATALERLAQARHAIETNDYRHQGEYIGKAMAIVSSLNHCLDMEQGDEIATNLHQLYDFMLQKMAEANLHKDVKALDDISFLLKEIKEAWDLIPKEQHHMSAIVD
ncbi:flagellar export chaperone FliS [Shewanella marina]|uniref:flagellar export chaperone FliS n=1 Tax=Shewanella marina TaxID=487319 RepID=UPI00046F1668|nr:flagellar export chaperone FliS [Shewanella marina]